MLKFKAFLSDTRSDNCIKTSLVSLNRRTFERCRYVVGNKVFHDQLIKLGCATKKSLTLTFPSNEIFIDQQLVFDFIRGYIDGDGCLYSNRSRLAIDICGTESFLNSIRLILPEFSKPMKDKRNDVYRIVCSHSSADKVAKILYKNATVYLTRKYDKFAELYRDV